MTPDVREDPGDALSLTTDRYTSGEELKSVAEAGFEAGLAVIIEAMPTASVVIDTSCRVLASNSAAYALVGRLETPETKGALCRAAGQLSLSTGPGLVTLNHGMDCQEYFIVPLPGPSARGKTLFLVGLVPDETTRGSTSHPPLSSHNLAPSPVGVLREQALKFKRLSETDPLTGALNVRAFAAHVRQTLARAPEQKGALIFVDLNGFKSINDKFGHAAGDKVLVHVAAKLTFAPHTGIATARMGGDEFALWVPFVEQSSRAKIIDRVFNRLSDPVDLSEYVADDTHVTVTAAIGAAHCPVDACNYETLRRVADKRMYEDKARAQ
ncbi:MAG: GGDEF domain-containing protein [Pseudomonadota bacterium]